MGALLCNRYLESSLTSRDAIAIGARDALAIGARDALAIGARVSTGALVCNRCLESSLTSNDAIDGDDDADCEGDGADEDDGEEAPAVRFWLRFVSARLSS
jgi:hypothetical protein